MDSLQATYKDEEEEEDAPLSTTATPAEDAAVTTADAVATGCGTDTESVDVPPVTTTSTASDTPTEAQNDARSEPDPSDYPSDDEAASDEDSRKKSPKSAAGEGGGDNDDDDEEEPPPKKQKHLSSLTAATVKEEPTMVVEAALPHGNINGASEATPMAVTSTGGTTTGTNSKKSKKKNNNVWATKSKKSKKKSNKGNNNNNNHNNNHGNGEDKVLITPVPRFPDKSDDTAEMKICLSKVYKAEKVELSEDRMVAGSTKGYRMVRATRGVVEGAWYFEIRVLNLGETGHTRLGWSTEKGDLQAPVGYDGNSFGYRDVDGSKVHKALREQYGEEGYKEGDVIGFYINLPEGEKYAPQAPQLVWYKGQRYVVGHDPKEEPKVVPGALSPSLTLLSFIFHHSSSSFLLSSFFYGFPHRTCTLRLMSEGELQRAREKKRARSRRRRREGKSRPCTAAFVRHSFGKGTMEEGSDQGKG